MNKNVRKVGRPSVTSREEILAAAVALLQQEELSALSLRQLAKQLDLSPTSLYRYFESKQQLITALGKTSSHWMPHLYPPVFPASSALKPC